MPIIKSAKKALKQSLKRQSRNQHFKDMFRESRKVFEAAVKNNDLEGARKAFFNTKEDGRTTKSGLQSNIDKLVKKNLIHKNNGDRKKSKYAGIIKKMESALQS